MWIILLCSVVALGVFLERLIYLHRVSIRIGELLGGLSLLIRNGRIAEALGECSAMTGPVSRVLLAALLRPNEQREVLQSITRDSALLEIPKLEKNLLILATLAYVTLRSLVYSERYSACWMPFLPSPRMVVTPRRKSCRGGFTRVCSMLRQDWLWPFRLSSDTAT